MEQVEIEAFHKENNFIGWTETSAKEGDMVNDSMRYTLFKNFYVNNFISFKLEVLTAGELIFFPFLFNYSL